MAERRQSSRTVLAIAGVLLAIAGTVVAAAGGILFGVFGSDGRVASGTHPISTGRTALVSSVADLTDVSDVADVGSTW
jgi:hypothetical protein